MELIIVLLLLAGFLYYYATGKLGGVPKLIKTLVDEDFKAVDLDCEKYKKDIVQLLQHEEGDAPKIDLLFEHIYKDTTLKEVQATLLAACPNALDQDPTTTTASGTSASGTSASGTTASGTTASGTSASGTTASSVINCEWGDWVDDPGETCKLPDGYTCGLPMQKQSRVIRVEGNGLGEACTGNSTREIDWCGEETICGYGDECLKDRFGGDSCDDTKLHSCHLGDDNKLRCLRSNRYETGSCTHNVECDNSGTLSCDSDSGTCQHPPSDCQYSSSSWSGCVPGCGHDRVKTFTTNIIKQPTNGGATCPPVSGTETCEDTFCGRGASCVPSADYPQGACDPSIHICAEVYGRPDSNVCMQFHNTVDNGRLCYSHAECKDALICNWKRSTLQAAGACETPLEVGEMCVNHGANDNGNARECAEGLVCVPDTYEDPEWYCMEKLPEGGLCSSQGWGYWYHPCADGLECSEPRDRWSECEVPTPP